MRFYYVILLLGAAAILLPGCKGGDDGEAFTVPADRLEQIAVTLDGKVGPANVGIRIAEVRGFFEDVGLEVRSGAPMLPGRPVRYVSTRSVDFGVTQEPQLVIGREKGAAAVAVGSLISEPTAALIWLKSSGIRDLADLKGKTIAIPGIAFQEGFLRAILARAGLTLDDVEVKRLGYAVVPALLEHRADAIFGDSWNVEGAQLEAQGARPVIKRVQGLGVPSYAESVVITHPERLREDPESVRAFLSAVARGNAVAERHPEAAAKLIRDDHESNSEATPKGTEAGLRATLPLLSRDGYLDPGQETRLAEWMSEEGLVHSKSSASDVLTNDYLAQP